MLPMFFDLPKIKKGLLAVYLTFILVNIVFAQGVNNLLKALGGLCHSLQGLLAVAAIVLVVLAAIVYALGQMLGAETRARATVWATAMFTGAIISILIWLIMPPLISTLMTGESSSDWVKQCCVPDPEPGCGLTDSGEG